MRTEWALRASVLALAAATLAACAGGPKPDKAGVAGEPTSRYGGYKVGQPYQVKGVWYYPKDEPSYDEIGIASWYGEQFHNHYTADGEIFDMGMPSAAHKTLPLPSLVEVTNLANGRKVIVRVNDRGPFVDGRVIDMSKAAAEELGFVAAGVTKVRVRYVGRADAPPEPRQYQASNSQPQPSLPKPSLPKTPFSLSPPPIQWAMAAPPIVAPISGSVSIPHGSPALPTTRQAVSPPAAAPAAAAPVETAPIETASAGLTGTAGSVLQPVTQTALTPVAPQGPPSYVAQNATAPTTAAPAAASAPMDDVSALLSDSAPAIASAAVSSAAAATPAPGVIGYQLQAGVFASRANADALAARLSGVGSPQIEEIQRAGQILYRVTVHGFANPVTAAAARSQAAALGAPDARVVAGS